MVSGGVRTEPKAAGPDRQLLLFSTLREYIVPLERASETQLILCHPERELLPLVLSHCHYTLKKGGETGSSYDLPAIQMHLVRRFLAGKPQIQEVKTNTVNPKKRCAVSEIVLPTLLLSDQIQDTSRYLNRCLQDFSVVLDEVRGKIQQVKISLDQSVLQERSQANAHRRFLCGIL